jgi:hypothetical protein
MFCGIELMMAVVGLVVLVIGRFRVGDKVLERPFTSMIGTTLLAALPLDFILSLILGFSMGLNAASSFSNTPRPRTQEEAARFQAKVQSKIDSLTAEAYRLDFFLELGLVGTCSAIAIVLGAVGWRPVDPTRAGPRPSRGPGPSPSDELLAGLRPLQGLGSEGLRPLRTQTSAAKEEPEEPEEVGIVGAEGLSRPKFATASPQASRAVAEIEAAPSKGKGPNVLLVAVGAFVLIFGVTFAGLWLMQAGRTEAPDTGAAIAQVAPVPVATEGKKNPPPETVKEEPPEEVKNPVVKPPPTVAVPPFDQLVANLKGGDTRVRDDAVKKLADMTPVASRRAEVVRLLIPILAVRDYFQGQNALEALKAWATRDDVPELLPVLKSESDRARDSAIILLGKLKDPRSAAPLVKMLESERDRSRAVEVLRKFGPDCEIPVQGCLIHKQPQIRRDACEILRSSGTVKSLGALQPLLRDPECQTAAKAAIEEIKRR